jgi:hypothetical protein
VHYGLVAFKSHIWPRQRRPHLLDDVRQPLY